MANLVNILFYKLHDHEAISEQPLLSFQVLFFKTIFTWIFVSWKYMDPADETAVSLKCRI